METTELLKDRYKVIAGNPFDKFYYVGLIITIENEHQYYTDDADVLLSREFDFDEYPHLFKKMNWHEERDEKDMPEYLKGNTPEITGMFKVYKWVNQKPEGLHFIAEKPFVGIALKNVLPASKEEYENQSK